MSSTSDHTQNFQMESSNFSKSYGKINPLEDKTSTENNETPKKSNATMVTSLTLIFALIVGALIGALIHESASESHPSNTDQSSPSSPSSSPSFGPNWVESLKTVCGVTQHPDSCFATITTVYTPPKVDPVHFYNLSLQVTIQELTNISSLPKNLIPRSNDQGTRAALQDCMDLFGDAMDQLNKALEEMVMDLNEIVLTDMVVGDMETWLSAAMTDQETCLEGLEEMESSLVEEVKARVQNCKEYMGNSLAILNNMESLLQKFSVKTTP